MLGTSLAMETSTGRLWWLEKRYTTSVSGNYQYSFRRLASNIDRAEAERLYQFARTESAQWYKALDISASDLAAIERYEAMQREYTLWRDYQQLGKIAKNKPIADIPAAPAGESLPISPTSSFAGKTGQFTKRDGMAEAPAKDWVSYNISGRLASSDDFIKAMASNDGLGDWIAGAGRVARPAVQEAATKWRSWTPAERETFLRSGVRESGYNQWIYREGKFERGTYINSSLTDGQAFVYDYTSQMVQQWAVTSGDSHILSVALQRAAMEEFNLQQYTTLEHFANRAHQGGFGVDAGPLLPASETFYAANGTDLRLFLRAMYDVTQEELALAGIDTVRVVRGVGSYPVAATKEWSDAGLRLADIAQGASREGAVDLQPMSSFAVSTGTAKKFGQKLIYADIPSSWVIGTCRTGFGCLHEYEWVVLGGPMRATIQNVARSSYG
jgi:hypothetical protein